MPADVEHRRGESEEAQMSEPITVMIADDHELVTRSLRLGLSREGDMAVIANAGELQASTDTYSVAAQMPRVLVLIVQAANGSTVELIRRLRAQAPATAIVVLTGQDAPTFADTVMDLGVSGYVLGDEAEGELPYAIRSAAHGVAYISPPVAVQLAALRRVSGADGLSMRETEVLRLIALGFTASEIADRLHLSQRTIETHRSQICRKLGLEKRWELVRYALSRHLIGDPGTLAWEPPRTADGRNHNQNVDRAHEAIDRASALAEQAQAVLGQARHVQARTKAHRANAASDYHAGPQ
jgi:DNA-binding NarL/FixJ family response regulator